MRVEFVFSARNKITLPIHHTHILQGLIYNSFSDRSLSEFLHNEGYQWNKRRFKLFSFSRLMGNFYIDKQKSHIIFESPVKLVITSVKDEIIQDVASNIIKNNGVQLGREKLFLDEVRFEVFKASGDRLKINMLSPVVTYRTEEIEGRKKTHYYNPWDVEFEEQIYNNLCKKFEIITGKKPDQNSFSIKPLFDRENSQPNIVLYRNYVIKGWSGQFDLSGNLDLLKIAYDAGIGAKNSLGHGCFTIIRGGDQHFNSKG